MHRFLRATRGLGKSAVIALFVFFAGRVNADLGPHDYSVELTAQVAENPNRITLRWTGDTNATTYFIRRKLLGATDWNDLGAVPGSALNWADGSADVGIAYEYQVSKATTLGITGYGYICAAIKRAPVETRGRLILLVESSLAGALPGELAQLQQDLVGDGWTVLRHDVPQTASPPEVKALIKADFDGDRANTKAVFLFGHIAVPYSGNISADSHEDHVGAWPADVFYGEFDGSWTDTTVNHTDTSVPNVPGDGKYDQNRPPGTVRLQIGRVDLSNLTCFANKTPARYEVDLARQYLAKDHYFRHGKFAIKRRALIFDRQYRGLEKEPQTCAAWRSFPGFFGPDQVRVIGPYEYFPTLGSESYLWSYCVSGGSYYGSDYIGTSDAWALNEPKVVFTSFLGSYFGEWNRESDFLRAPLGTSGYTLTCIFSGQPQWILHPMSMGEPIGYTAMLTQNNSPHGLYPPQVNGGASEVHVALMGDPTLRMHPVSSPSNLRRAIDGQGVHLNWSPSEDSAVLGYYVYRATSLNGPFSHYISFVSAPSFTDAAGGSGDVYMVRAVKLEETPSGSYYNLSQGAFNPDSLIAQQGPLLPPTGLAANQITPGAVTLEWVQQAGEPAGFEVQRRDYPNGTFQKIGQTSATASLYQDQTISRGAFAYRVKALGAAGDSNFTPEVVVNLKTPTAAIIGVDDSTQGNWIGHYGLEGYHIPFAGTNLPPYIKIGSSNAVEQKFTWTYPYTLLYPNGQGQVSSDWVPLHGAELILSLRFSDSAKHRISLYFVEGSGKRNGILDILDPFTGQIMDSMKFGAYTNGKYLVVELQNYADLRVQTEGGDYLYRPVVSGLFLDPVELPAPTITPANGAFAVAANVNMQAIPGATVHYTLDGSDPGPDSPVFTGPIRLVTNALVSAVAIKPLYPPSAISRVQLSNSLKTTVVLAGTDESTKGEWRPTYGVSGWSFVGLPPHLPSYLEIDTNVNAWIWDDATTDIRALKTFSRLGVRMASCWFAPNTLSMDVIINTNSLQQVALYFMDWNGGRVQDVTISDLTGKVLVQKRLEQFTGGRYLVFNARGGFRITVDRIGAINAILNGIFIGPAPISAEPPQFDVHVTFAGGIYTFRINGQPGQVFNIQSSSDFRAWTDVAQCVLSESSAQLSIPISGEPGVRFYRAVLAQ